jgi:hypothetical protein
LTHTGLTQRFLIDAAPGAAVSQLTVNGDCGY